MNAKAQFLKQDFVSLLKTIAADTPPKWGKMSLQQMVEHFSDSLRIASGAAPHETIVTPPENLQRMRDFMMSEKPFKENTINALLSETPPPVRNKTISEALNELQKEIDYFFEVFEEKRQQSSRNPFFGDLNFEENVQLLYKHALHHLKQFGIEVNTVQQ
jgi:hypothetical protein